MEKQYDGNSIANAIVIDANDTFDGVTQEHNYIDHLCSKLDTGIKSMDQTLIKENQRYYDKFIIKIGDGSERIMYFDVTSFFGQ
jgi:hypothetical protein